jgi:NAD(P)-dependent dehydrogenase (short-subunit alcohol dehydrogenase family)
MADQRAIFITGGGSGIGRAIAQRFAAAGWAVGLGDVSEKGMEETAALLPGGAFTHRFDVRERGAWDEALAAFAAASGGRIDVVANNAGVPLGGPLAELTREEIDRTLDINLRGAIYGAQAAYSWLKASAPGSCLLNTASAAALYGMSGQSIYGATKAGVRSLTETLDAEWAPDGIRVRSLMPSFIDTPLLKHPPNASRNVSIRQAVEEAGLEFTPVEVVAENAWDAVHGDKVHYVVGKTARRMRFAAKWMPSRLRTRARLLSEAGER